MSLSSALIGSLKSAAGSALGDIVSSGISSIGSGQQKSQSMLSLGMIQNKLDNQQKMIDENSERINQGYQQMNQINNRVQNNERGIYQIANYLQQNQY